VTTASGVPDAGLGFSALYLKERLGSNYAFGFALIAAGAAFVFSGRA
jgi:uncharacterized protein